MPMSLICFNLLTYQSLNSFFSDLSDFDQASLVENDLSTSSLEAILDWCSMHYDGGAIKISEVDKECTNHCYDFNWLIRPIKFLPQVLLFICNHWHLLISLPLACNRQVWVIQNLSLLLKLFCSLQIKYRKISLFS